MALVVAILVVSCATEDPPVLPTTELKASPVTTPRPTATQVPDAVPGPPYRIISGGGGQKRGTILFGDLDGNAIAPFSGYPLSFTIDRDLAYGAYFDEPVDVPAVTLALARQDGAAWTQVWSSSKPVSRGATGILGLLPRFEEPGIYRLDVMAEDVVIASSLMSMVPPCVGVCTGG
ncbi:MAG: hypothetical protein L0227_17120 [Chloroflexi bacterium]|nr:hypothetical protein [Chloroflexota bacterium]